MTAGLHTTSRRILGLDALACAGAVVLGVAGGLVVLVLGETLTAGSLGPASLDFHPWIFLAASLPGFSGAGLAVLAAHLVRRVSGTERTAGLEALLGAVLAGLGTMSGLFVMAGMGTQAMMLIGPPVALCTWLALRRSGLIASRRAARGLS